MVQPIGIGKASEYSCVTVLTYRRLKGEDPEINIKVIRKQAFERVRGKAS